MEALKYPLQGGKQVQNFTIFAALSEPQVLGWAMPGERSW
jgi:hypothetical protein